MKQNRLGNFGRGSSEEYLCDLNLGQQFRRRCCLKMFLFLALALVTILFSGADLFGKFC